MNHEQEGTKKDGNILTGPAVGRVEFFKAVNSRIQVEGPDFEKGLGKVRRLKSGQIIGRESLNRGIQVFKKIIVISM